MYQLQFVLFALTLDVDSHVLDIVERFDVDNTVLVLLGENECVESALCIALLFVDVVIEQLYALQMLFGLNVVGNG